MKNSKNYAILRKDLDLTKTYEPIEAIKILKERTFVKFDETIDVSIDKDADNIRETLSNISDVSWDLAKLVWEKNSQIS